MMSETYEELGLTDPKKAAREAKLYACQRVLRFVKWMMDNWPELGRPINPNADVLMHAVFARSTRTYEAVVKHLGNAGFGEQGIMLCRSLFEDMLDAHWISLNRDLAIDRIKEHDQWCTHLRRNVVGAFPDYFEEDLPEAAKLSAEAQKL